MMLNSRIKKTGFTLILLSVLLMCFAFASAQYTTQKTTEVAIPESGTVVVEEPEIGVTYEISGAEGTTGSVTTTEYTGNPQPEANVPENIALKKFVVVEFDIAEEDFEQAVLTFTYTDEEVAGIDMPYAIYKYLPDSDTFVELESVWDEAAKTITVTLDSTTDPLFAIGGASAEPVVAADYTWVAVVVIVVVVVLIGFLLLKRYRK